MISGAAATTLGAPTWKATARSTPRMSLGGRSLLQRVGDLPGVGGGRRVERDQRRDFHQRVRARVEARALAAQVAQPDRRL